MYFLTLDGAGYFTTNYFSRANRDLKQTCFECDELVGPILSVLIKKGFKTEYSCQGHYYDRAMTSELDEENTEKTRDISFEDNIGYSWPYILFAEGVRVQDFGDALRNLPDGWRFRLMPHYTERSNTLLDYDGPTSNLVDYYALSEEQKSIVDSSRYRISIHYYLMDKILESISGDKDKIDMKDIYKFYSKLVSALSDLYEWAKAL